MIKHKDHFHGSDLEKIEQIYGIKKEEIVSFSANVNPLGVSPLLRTALSEQIDVITTYPDREYTSLRKCIAEYCGTEYENVIVGNGSTELISLFIQIEHPKKAMGIMLTAVFIIVCLNPLFIFGFGWGVRGSAFATITGQCVALVLEFTHFLNRKHFLYLKRGTFRFIGTIVRKVLSIGMAPFLLNVCASIVVIFINNALKKTGGDISIGAYGIVNRVLMLFVMIVNGLNQGMQPIVGYNYGARQFDRVIRTLKLNIVCAVCVTTFGFILGHFFPHLVAGMFTDDPTLLSVAEMGLKISLLAFPIAGFQIVSSGFFQYIGKPQKAILLSLTRQLLFLVPLLAVLPDLYGTMGVWASMPIADCLAAFLAGVLLFFQIRKMRRHPDEIKVI